MTDTVQGAPGARPVPQVVDDAVRSIHGPVRGADLDVGLIFFLSMIGLETVGIVMAGWSSNNKYALISSLRMVGMTVSYEIPMLLSLLVASSSPGHTAIIYVDRANETGTEDGSQTSPFNTIQEGVDALVAFMDDFMRRNG